MARVHVPILVCVSYKWQCARTDISRYQACSLLCVIMLSSVFCVVRSEVIMKAYDSRRTSWFKNEGMTRAIVTSSDFIQRQQVSVPGQVYGQLLAYKNKLFAVTEKNYVLALDPVTLSTIWSVQLGQPVPSSSTNCDDLSPFIGITSTPVIDPATDTIYIVSHQQTSRGREFHLDALDVNTGSGRANFPVNIQGRASNGGRQFDVSKHNQRPGLLLMDGVIYSAYASYCDRPEYQGWIIGVATSGQITTLWTSEPTGREGGIWMAGGGIMSDAPGQMVITTGNGNLPNGAATKANVPASLGMALVRLRVKADGNLEAIDFYIQGDASGDNARDLDFGNTGAVSSPPGSPSVVLTMSKVGDCIVADGTNFGGYNPGGQDNVLYKLGRPGSPGSSLDFGFETPSSWGPDPTGTTYLYFLGVNWPIYSWGLTSVNGRPSVSFAAQSDTGIPGIGTTTAIISTVGNDPSSALLWVVTMRDRSGADGTLRIYEGAPSTTAQRLRTLKSFSIPRALKFNSPIVYNGRAYVVGIDPSDSSNSIIYMYGGSGSVIVPTATVRLPTPSRTPSTSPSRPPTRSPSKPHTPLPPTPTRTRTLAARPPTPAAATPSKQPVTPSKKPVTPSKRPATPSKKPATPSKQPVTPSKKPATPTPSVGKIATPTARNPTAKPSVTLPSSGSCGLRPVSGPTRGDFWFDGATNLCRGFFTFGIVNNENTLVSSGFNMACTLPNGVSLARPNNYNYQTTSPEGATGTIAIDGPGYYMEPGKGSDFGFQVTCSRSIGGQNCQCPAPVCSC